MNGKFTLIGVGFVLVVFLFVVFFGFGLGVEVPINETAGEIPLKGGEAPFEVSSNRYALDSEVSSFLPYDASAHLSYESSLAYDENWKTAWCTSEAFPYITLTFEETTDLGSVGIVPGYATSEEMFFKNARIKEMAVSYNGYEQVDGVDEVLSFEDTYGMQFFDLKVRDIQSVSFQVLETYPGSKYLDVCLAEVDFWSDFVETQDGDRALTLGADPLYSAQVCEDGRSFPDEDLANSQRESYQLFYPEEVTEAGARYFIEDWDLGFWIPSEFESYHVFEEKVLSHEFSPFSLRFAITTDAACLPYGDAMGIYLFKGDDWHNILGEGSENITKDRFTLGSLTGNTYREDWFGGDSLTYAFSFKNALLNAGTLACPLDEKDCEELKSEAFMKSLLSTLH